MEGLRKLVIELSEIRIEKKKLSIIFSNSVEKYVNKETNKSINK